MQLSPYLAFHGKCEEAMTFYKDCLGGEFEGINRFRDGPDELGGTKIPAAMKDQVMHMTWRFDGNVVMACDSVDPIPEGGNVTLCVDIGDLDRVDAAFDELSAGGTITLPLENTFWGARYAIVEDPSGNAVGLMSPIDPARRSGPSPPPA